MQISNFLFLSLVRYAATSSAHSQLPGPETIIWGACSPAFESTLSISCGNITVPLDYSIENSPTFELELLRVNAPTQPSRGSVLVNYGGPGIPVRANLALSGLELQTLTGGHYDLIGWDPRGTGNTLTFSCYENATTRESAGWNRVPLGNASSTALGRVWTVASLAATKCATFKDSKAVGELIGTAFTVKDMMKIVDATNEDGLLRYYGYSYGATLGATASAMFPHKVDKVVIDSVLDPTDYFYGQDFGTWVDADATFSQYFEQCMLHPKECVLARGDATAASLEAATYAFIEKLKSRPLSVNGTIFDYAAFRSTLRFVLYGPTTWALYSRYLNGLLTGNHTQFTEAYKAFDTLFTVFTGIGGADESPYGIHCVDKIPRISTFEEFEKIAHKFWDISTIQGDGENLILAMCMQWKMEPKQRYLGGFHNIKTKSPLLVIGVTYDPATSVKSAVKVAAGFEGAVFLKHNGFGHGSNAQPSMCTARIIKSYFTDGTLPKSETVCEPEHHSFANKQTIADRYDEI